MEDKDYETISFDSKRELDKKYKHTSQLAGYSIYTGEDLMDYWKKVGEHRGAVTVLDTVTGKTATEAGLMGYWWAEGNGSCDCNREILFDIHTSGDTCINCERYLIIKHDYPNYTLNELNSDYNKELIDKHCQI